MKNISPETQAHLDSGSSTMAYCWRVTRTDGKVFGFTEHDEDLEFGGDVYSATTGFTSSALESGLGFSVDNTEATGALSSDVITDEDLEDGKYDNAVVDMYWVNWQNPEQQVYLSSGNIGQVQRTEFAYQTEFRSKSHRLQQRTGRTYKRTCDALFCDERCGLRVENFTHEAIITGSADAKTYTINYAGGLPDNTFASGYFSLGILEVDGKQHSIKRHSQEGAETVIELWEDTRITLDLGTKCSLIVGCDKSFKTCIGFNNAPNFRGFPHIPGSDYLTRNADDTTSTTDGGSIFK